jgi:VanZ family protein
MKYTLARLGWVSICVFIVYESLGEWSFYQPGIWAPTLVVIRDVIENVLVYIAFGALAVLSMADARHRHWARRALKVSLLALLFSSVNEVLQLYTIDRIASLTDIVSAVIGAFVGGAAASSLSTSGGGAMSREPR